MKAFLREPLPMNQLPKGVLAIRLSQDTLKLKAPGKGSGEAKTDEQGSIFFLDGPPALLALFD